MPESSKDEIVQRDLLGNPIERKIPRSVEASVAGQTTLDEWVDKINNPGVTVEIVQDNVLDKKSSKKKQDKLIINKGTRDEMTLLGRYYTPTPGREVWTAPAERRDAYPKLSIDEKDVIFQIKDSDVWENAVRWTRVVALARTAPGEGPKIKGHGYMRWSDISKR